MSARADRIPPHDLGAERAVLGSVLLDNEALDEVGAILRPGDFHRRSHHVIFEVITDLFGLGSAIDVVILKDALAMARKLEDAGGEEALHDLAGAVPTAANAFYYARIVKDKAIAREGMYRAEKAARAFLCANGNVRQLLVESRDALQELYDESNDSADAALPLHTVEELRAMPESNVEWAVRGFIPHRALTVLGAQQKAGKSTVLFGLLRELETGNDFAGFHVPRPIRAVYLSEEPAALVLQKADVFGVRDALFMCREDKPQPWPTLIDAAAKAAHRVGARLLVVDTFSRFVGLEEDKEKDSGAMQAAVDHALLASATGLAVLLVHHHRKGDGEHGCSLEPRRDRAHRR